VNRIICRSCESMSELRNACVSVTVTSPPYWNSIDYDRHAQDDKQWYRTREYREGFESYAEYLNLMGRVFREVFRVTRPGGFCCVVIGTVLIKGRHVPVPFDLLAHVCAVGWQFHQDIIWHKCTAGVKRAGVTIQKPYPGYYYPNIMTEYILVFRKKGDPISGGRPASLKRQARIPINALFTNDIANNVWHIAPVPPGHLDHPCPFPEEIPARLISLYSYPGDLVLDPFCGSGQTLKVAHHLRREYVGYDTVEKYVEYAAQRVRERLSLRDEQLIARFDKIPIDAALQGSGRRNKRSRSTSEASDAPLLFEA
jgi:DNA modification methylase